MIVNDALYNEIIKGGIKAAVDIIVEQSDIILLLSNNIDRMNDRLIKMEQELDYFKSEYKNHTHSEYNSLPI
jgi:hypothetical protein